MIVQFKKKQRKFLKRNKMHIINEMLQLNNISNFVDIAIYLLGIYSPFYYRLFKWSMYPPKKLLFTVFLAPFRVAIRLCFIALKDNFSIKLLTKLFVREHT